MMNFIAHVWSDLERSSSDGVRSRRCDCEVMKYRSLRSIRFDLSYFLCVPEDTRSTPY